MLARCGPENLTQFTPQVLSTNSRLHTMNKQRIKTSFACHVTTPEASVRKDVDGLVSGGTTDKSITSRYLVRATGFICVMRLWASNASQSPRNSRSCLSPSRHLLAFGLGRSIGTIRGQRRHGRSGIYTEADGFSHRINDACDQS